jgi:hypothetical protein
MLHIPAAQLKNQLAFRHESLVIAAAMSTLKAEELLIPAAARFNVPDANKRL